MLAMGWSKSNMTQSLRIVAYTRTEMNDIETRLKGTEIWQYPFRRQNPLEPAIEKTAILRSGSAQLVRLYNGRKVWLVTKHTDVRKILSSRKVSNFVNHKALPKLSSLDGKGNDQNPSFLHLDDPEHRRLRRPLTKFFTQQKAQEMRPVIDRVAKDLVTQLNTLDKPIDFVQHFARPLPLAITCGLLGLPQEEEAFFTRSTLDSVNVKTDQEKKTEAVLGLRECIASAIRERSKCLSSGGDINDNQDIDVAVN